MHKTVLISSCWRYMNTICVLVSASGLFISPSPRYNDIKTTDEKKLLCYNRQQLTPTRTNQSVVLLLFPSQWVSCCELAQLMSAFSSDTSVLLSEGCLFSGPRLSLNRILRWAFQFCFFMLCYIMGCRHIRSTTARGLETVTQICDVKEYPVSSQVHFTEDKLKHARWVLSRMLQPATQTNQRLWRGGSLSWLSALTGWGFLNEITFVSFTLLLAEPPHVCGSPNRCWLDLTE